MMANTSSVENLAAMSPVEMTGDTRPEGASDDEKRGKGGAERVASASRQMLSRRESTVFPDRWSIRILAEAASTLARCGVVGRSADASLGNNSIVGHVFRGHDRRRHTDKARTRPGGGAGDHRRRPSLPVASKRSKIDIAATVHGLIFCGSGPSSELPMIVDFGSSLVGVSPRARGDLRFCSGTATDPSQGSPRRRQRTQAANVESTSPRRNRESGAPTSSRESFVAGGGQASAKNVYLGFHDPVVAVSPACRTDGGDVDSGGGGCVSRGRRRREQRRSRIDIAENVHRWTICGSGSSSELPMIVDSGSIRLEKNAQD